MSTDAVFSTDPAAATDTLRRVAARGLGWDGDGDSTHQAVVDQGDPTSYLNLNASDQVMLTDAMAALIVQYPAGWSDQVVADAQARVNNAAYGTPLADSSYTGNLIDQVASGQFLSNALGGGASYLKTIGIFAGLGVALIVASNLAKD